MSTGSWFPVPDEPELPERLQGLFAKARASLGFVPNVFRVWAFRPERLSAWFSHFRSLHEPSANLGAADREMIAVVVSQANGCLYCLVAHGAALRQELGDPVLGERIAFDWRRSGLDPRRAAICAYAEKLTLTPRAMTRDDLQTLLDAGLSVEEAWDVAEIASMYNLTNRMAMATNMLPNEEYAALARMTEPLPQDHERYFVDLDGAEIMPLGRLRPTVGADEQPDSVAEARRRMRAAAAGLRPRRAPLTVRAQDGELLIVDGNATFAVACEDGWQTIPVSVV